MNASQTPQPAVPAYEREPYRRQLEVEVVRVALDEDRPYAVLDDTILYPEGGGQPSDRGSLGEIAVVEVRRVDGVIRHYLERPAAVGPKVLSLDWGRRFDHMQQHTAQHLLTAAAVDRSGWATTAFHLGADTSSIDLDREPLAPPELVALEQAVLEEIAGARPISSRRVDRQEFERLVATGDVRSRRLPPGHRGDVRLVEIEGLDCNSCGGTHLASVAEIATFKLLSVEPAHGGCRLFWVAGDRVRRRLGELEERSTELRRLFETSAEEMPHVARLKLDQLRDAQRRLRELEGRYAEAVAAELAVRSGATERHFTEVDGGFLRRVARSYSARPGRGILLLTGEGEKGEFFALAIGPESPIDLQEMGTRVADLLDGRGGGAGQLFQGKAGSLERRDEAFELLARPQG